MFLVISWVNRMARNSFFFWVTCKRKCKTRIVLPGTCWRHCRSRRGRCRCGTGRVPAGVCKRCHWSFHRRPALLRDDVPAESAPEQEKSLRRRILCRRCRSCRQNYPCSLKKPQKNHVCISVPTSVLWTLHKGGDGYWSFFLGRLSPPLVSELSGLHRECCSLIAGTAAPVVLSCLSPLQWSPRPLVNWSQFVYINRSRWVFFDGVVLNYQVLPMSGMTSTQ